MEQVSVIIPTFNSAKYLPQTIESVVKQSYDRIELIIVDDGSSDQTLEIIESYAKKHDQIIYFNRSGDMKGGSVCRNEGLEKASGTYIIFLDSDDLLEKGCIENRVNAFQKYPDRDFLVFNTGFFYNRPGDHPSRTFPNVPKNRHILTFLAWDVLWYATGPFWKREFLEKLGGFNIQFQRFQDTEISLRGLLMAKGNYEHLETLDSHYRIYRSLSTKVTKPPEFIHRVMGSTFLFFETFEDQYKSNAGKYAYGIVLLKSYLTVAINTGDMTPTYIQQLDPYFWKHARSEHVGHSFRILMISARSLLCSNIISLIIKKVIFRLTYSYLRWKLFRQKSVFQ